MTNIYSLQIFIELIKQNAQFSNFIECQTWQIQKDARDLWAAIRVQCNKKCCGITENPNITITHLFIQQHISMCTYSALG